MISGKVTGAKLLDKKLGAVVKSAVKNSEIAVQKATLRLHEEAVKIVGENEGGSQQQRYKPNRVVSVSDPFEPPHKDKGILQKSIKFNFKKGTGEVGTNLKYGAWLEFGTERMAPRPWLAVAVDRVSKEIGEIFFKWIEKTVEVKK